ncbi:hypothetical protein BBB56_13600 [Candidatus Pantoea deserta]|uniref:Uncharacterized protein n=1 Tax=Candidatus Pantoea deserta TaxID=1869313 RepID=A0A3N4NWT1_9GAMM|nr:hypothetical protein BBB56_13600 [Pantoea deserta]
MMPYETRYYKCHSCTPFIASRRPACRSGAFFQGARGLTGLPRRLGRAGQTAKPKASQAGRRGRLARFGFC